MTFDEWWKVMKPAECDEVKEYFVEAYLTGYDQGVCITKEVCAKLCDEEASIECIAQRCADKIRFPG